MTDQSVQVKLELGHRAEVRTKPTPEGYTHDWTVFVRAPEGSSLQHFVQKVIFQLHESFPKPKRAVKEPPYRLTESGYGSFILPIEIYFRNKDPSQIRFDYDLFLNLDGNRPVNHLRCELLTFQNPTDDFRQKLLKAGGVIIGGSGEPVVPAISPLPPAPMHTDLFDAPVVASKHCKKHKHHHKEKKSKVRSGSNGLTSGSSTPSSTGGVSTQSHPKHGGKGPLGDRLSSTEKSPVGRDKNTPKTPSESAVSPVVRDHVTPTLSSPAKRPADLAFSPSTKYPADVISPCSSLSSSKKQRREKDSSTKDHKGSSSGEKSSHSRKDKSRSMDSKSKSHKSSKRDRRDAEAKPSHGDTERKSVSSSKSAGTPRDQAASKSKVELPAFEEELSTGELSEPDPFEDSVDIGAAAHRIIAEKSSSDRKRGRGLSALIAELGDCDSDSPEELLSPLSATSPPPLFPEFQSTDTTKQHLTVDKPVKVSSPALKSESRLSPLAADSSLASPAKASQSSPCNDKLIIHKVSPSDKYTVKKVSPLPLDATGVSSQEKSGRSKHDRGKKSKSERKPKEHRCKDKENDAARERTEPMKAEPDQDASLLPLNQIDRSKQHAPNGESLSTLLELQERLMAMTDARLLQRIVSIIEETGNYKINDTTFDFDLYCLDRNTVQKLLGFLLHAAS